MNADANLNTIATLPPPLLPGQRVGEYETRQALESNEASVSCLATDRMTGNKVAIKEFLPTRLVRRRDDGEIVPVDSDGQPIFERALQRFLSECEVL
ncbi:MAG: hypothetical protein HOI95_06375 [Chromatiales bacterium]|nr:hypothetical protein [Chromatiales bacterium]